MPLCALVSLSIMKSPSGVDDPDQSSTAFDDLRGASAARTPQAQLSLLKSATGGLRLCYMLMFGMLLEMVKIMYVVSQECWTWYTHHVKKMKRPMDNLQYAVQRSEGAWASEPHLSAMIKLTLYDPKQLQFMGINYGDFTPHAQMLAHRALDVMWHLLGHRAWSMATRLSIPPESYANLASSNPARRQAAANRMKSDWRCLLLLEQRVAQVPAAEHLWKDLILARNKPFRMLNLFYERDKYNPDSALGQETPDNNIVEDIHKIISDSSTSRT